MLLKKRYFAFLIVLFSPLLMAQERIISIGGIVTEIVYLLEGQDQLVATDTSSIYPDAASHTPKVGYQRTLSVEGVLSMKPDVLLITPATGPAKVLAQLQEAGIKLVSIDGDDSQQGIVQRVTQVAKALNKEAQGQQAVAEINASFSRLQAPTHWSRPPRLLFVLQMHGAPMIAGQGTAPDALFKMAGAVNAAEQINGYKTLTPEALLAIQPDAIVVTTQGLDRAGAASIWSLPGLSITPAAKAKRLVDLDALMVLGLGPRTPQAIESLQQQLSDWTP
ncbi:heme/hemin ABC transporter substrate-binding protein [Marinomonas transparens]|uniref:ABC transporter substrate-binding protein n=1 Tax=Marinomonas transparens TaxID=2795388 RepID=A0A934MW96_9GAMM|nr:ABC transporter substrate-binding protein [Marinomonas transparens]MBJ7537924.1 ABC transporter substrate-binding protein [Marinomonas transparens]